MNALLVMPVAIPMGTAAVCILGRRKIRWVRAVSVLAMAALIFVGIALTVITQQQGVQVSRIGNWPAPYGIVIVADLFSAIMVVLAGLMGLAVALYSLADIQRPHQAFGYWPLLHLLLMGVCGAFLTGDIFNLYVWFEVMLMASFVLLVLGSQRGQLEGAIKYVSLNLFSSAMFLSGVGLLYGMAGTLNMADLSQKLMAPQANPALTTTVSMLFLVAFGIKAAMFPLFFWLPASYHTPPVAVSAIFAGLLTKVGVYALIRVFTLLFIQNPALSHRLLLILSGLTMVSGVLGAAAQFEFRRILSFHIISQIGYMIVGLAVAGLALDNTALAAFALAGSVFYICHHIVVKTNLFLISGMVRAECGSFELKQLGGLYASKPFWAVLFLVPAMSLAGLPPLSGFFAKLAVISASLQAGQWAIAATALIVGLLTLFSMTKIWAEVFWKAKPETDDSSPESPAGERRQRWQSCRVLPVTALAIVTVAIGLAAGPLFELSLQAAEQLLDHDAYRRAVLGSEP